MGICNSILAHEAISNEIIEVSRHDVSDKRLLTTPAKEPPSYIYIFLLSIPKRDWYICSEEF